MRIKSYFADSVGEALEKARRELGPEAMLMNSKKTEAELRALGAYEVVFAVAPEAATRELPKEAGEAPGVETRGKSEVRLPEGLARELTELRQQIESVKRSLERPAAAGEEEAAALRAALRAVDLPAELAEELAAAALERQKREGWDHASGALRALGEECQSRLRMEAGLGSAAEGGAPRAVLLAGPSGAGKTTTLVKLALRYGLRLGRPVQLLSLDSWRVGGFEQLAAYARIAGLPCEALAGPAALAPALTEYGGKKLLLIDTPGYSPGDEGQIRALGAALSAAAGGGRVDVHLVLPAVAQARVNLAALGRFAACAPAKLLFTRLDEAESVGPMLETALRAGLPVSFLGTGPQTPEDLAEASFERLLGPLAAAARESENASDGLFDSRGLIESRGVASAA